MASEKPKDTRTAAQRYRDTLLMKGTGEVIIWCGFSVATWIRYGDKLIDLIEKHPALDMWRPERGTDYSKWPGPANRAGEQYLDNWGCLWHCARDGMEGQILSHPLSDIRRLRNYKAPDPLLYTERGTHDWGQFVRNCSTSRARGDPVGIAGERFFERVHFLRGMEDALTDMAMEAPEIQEIVDLVLDYNLRYLRHALELGSPVDLVGFGDDWGCQDRCMISPATFRRYFKPGYTKMYALCKQYGALTTQHSDGYTVDLWDEFLEAGLTAFNMQANCVGVETIEKRLKGKMCIIADIDRQYILPRGTPDQVREHIKEVITRLGSPNGGLVIRADMYPDVPMENLAALLQAIEDYQYYWVGQ